MLDNLSELSACLNARYLHAFDLASAEADVYGQPADAGMGYTNQGDIQSRQNTASPQLKVTRQYLQPEGYLDMLAEQIRDVPDDDGHAHEPQKQCRAWRHPYMEKQCCA